MTPPMSIEFHPLQIHLAAEVRGIDLSRDLEDLVYRQHWRPGDLAIFCNRSCMHSATAYDYPHERRLMHRISVTGHV